MPAYGPVAGLLRGIFHCISRVLANLLGFIDSLVACATGGILGTGIFHGVGSFFHGLTGFFIHLNDRLLNRRPSEPGFDQGTVGTTLSVADYRASLNRYLCANGDAPIGWRFISSMTLTRDSVRPPDA